MELGYNEVLDVNHRVKIEYSAKVKEIESILSGLVMNASPENLQA